MRISKVERQEKVYVQRMDIVIGVLDEHAPGVDDIENLAHSIVGALELFEGREHHKADH